MLGASGMTHEDLEIEEVREQVYGRKAHRSNIKVIFSSVIVALLAAGVAVTVYVNSSF